MKKFICTQVIQIDRLPYKGVLVQYSSLSFEKSNESNYQIS